MMVMEVDMVDGCMIMVIRHHNIMVISVEMHSHQRAFMDGKLHYQIFVFWFFVQQNFFFLHIYRLGGGGGGGAEPPPNPDLQTQPAMLTLKQFLATQDDSISDSDAIEKYNDYKLEFKRQQLNEFFVAHKDEEW